MERTYVMLKPDAIQRGLVGEILQRIEKKGYRIVKMKTMQLEESILREHYAHIAEQPFFQETLSYMQSGVVICMIVAGENVIAGMRKLMGATKFEEAQAGTIRGDFGCSTTKNIIHGADTKEHAEVEIRRFFNES